MTVLEDFEALTSHGSDEYSGSSLRFKHFYNGVSSITKDGTHTTQGSFAWRIQADDGGVFINTGDIASPAPMDLTGATTVSIDIYIDGTLGTNPYAEVYIADPTYTEVVSGFAFPPSLGWNTLTATLSDNPSLDISSVVIGVTLYYDDTFSPSFPADVWIDNLRTDVGGVSFQVAWARNINTVIGSGGTV